MKIPITSVDWKTAYRIIPSRFPPIQTFSRIADDEDYNTLAYIEGLTNDRLRNERGKPQIVPPENCNYRTPNAVMAAFTHLSPSRFSDGSFSVMYVAKDLETAQAETIYHREKFMRDGNLPAMELDQRVYLLSVKGQFHDISSKANFTDCYDKTDYTAAQKLGKKLSEKNADGIIYKSVRNPKGLALAVFKPKAVITCVQAMHLAYLWDGKKISKIKEKRVF